MTKALQFLVGACVAVILVGVTVLVIWVMYLGMPQGPPVGLLRVICAVALVCAWASVALAVRTARGA